MANIWNEFVDVLPPHGVEVAVLLKGGIELASLVEVDADGLVTMRTRDGTEWRHTLLGWLYVDESLLELIETEPASSQDSSNG